jgi:hypothetical protein
VEAGTPDALGMFLDEVSVEEVSCGLEVEIDVVPCKVPNKVCIDGIGGVTVAILGSAEFDVSHVDLSTLNFAGLQVDTKHDGRSRCYRYGLWGSPQCPSDGFLDLVCVFKDNLADWAPDDGRGTLTGRLMDGTPFSGSDEILEVCLAE